MRVAAVRGSLRARRSSTARTIAAATVVGCLGRIDDREPLGFGLGHGQEPVPDAAMEGEVELGLEARDVVGCLARQPGLDRQVEQERQVRAEAVGRGSLERAQDVRSGPRPRSPGRRASNPRIGRRRRSGRPPAPGRRTSVTSCRRAALKRNASVSGSLRPPAPVRARRTSRMRSPSHVPPGSRVDEHVMPACLEPGDEALGLRRLAGPLGAFDGDEPAARTRGPG